MAAIVAGDILTKFSVSAAAGNTTAGTAATSLGDQISTTQWTGGALNDLFDDISGDENAASEAEYRCIFIHNSNANNIYENCVVWISSEVGGGANVAIGVDTTVASAIGSASAQALTVANEDTAPGGVTFTSPTTKATGIVMGNIGTGQCRAFWIRRTATNSAALSADGVTLSIAGDTGSL
jgi:hypothetical protein